MAYDHHHHPHRYYCYHNYWYPCYTLLLRLEIIFMTTNTTGKPQASDVEQYV